MTPGAASQIAHLRWPNGDFGRHDRRRLPTLRQRWLNVVSLADSHSTLRLLAELLTFTFVAAYWQDF